MNSYLQLYNLLLKRIKTLLTEKVFYSKEEYRESLSGVIGSFFPLLKWLGEEVGAQENIEELFAAFRRLYRVNGPETIGNVVLSPSQVEDMEDDINYLKISVSNICKVDLDNLDFSLPGESVQFQLKKEAIMPTEPDFFSDNMEESGFSSKILKTHINQIWRRFLLEPQRNILPQEFYIYKTKPKRNLVVKGLLILMWYMGYITSLFTFFYAIKHGQDNNSLGSLDCILILFSSSSFIAMTMVNFMLILLTLSDPLRRYRFCWKTSVYLVLSFLIFLILVVLSWSVTSLVFYYASPNFLKDEKSKNLWTSVFLITAVSTILHIFSCLVLKPKEDRETMERLIKECVSDSSDSLPQDL